MLYQWSAISRGPLERNYDQSGHLDASRKQFSPVAGIIRNSGHPALPVPPHSVSCTLLQTIARDQFADSGHYKKVVLLKDQPQKHFHI